MVGTIVALTGEAEAMSINRHIKSINTLIM